MLKSESRHKQLALTVFLLTGLGVSGLIAALALRSNSQRAQELYDQLLEADEQGEGVEEALNELRAYIYAHMNTEIGSENGIHPPIQLKNTYTRLVEAEQARLDADKNFNTALYDQAQAYCESQFGAGQLRSGRVQCVEAYVQENSKQLSEQAVSPDLYRFDFQPPLWSSDLAGFSVLSTMIFGLALAFLLTKKLIQRILNS